MVDTHSFLDLLLQMKICFDLHFFAAKQPQMFLNLNCLFIYLFIFVRNELAKWMTKGKFLVAKVEVLVALVTVLVTILSPETCG